MAMSRNILILSLSCSVLFSGSNTRSLGNGQQSVAASSSSSLTAPQPRFLSRGNTYRSVVGDTLVLPCQVEHLGEWTILIIVVNNTLVFGVVSNNIVNCHSMNICIRKFDQNL